MSAGFGRGLVGLVYPSSDPATSRDILFNFNSNGFFNLFLRHYETKHTI